ncbi:MAG: hypothetical protein WD601_01445, partial [Pseudohongiellaceae bacterium]
EYERVNFIISFSTTFAVMGESARMVSTQVVNKCERVPAQFFITFNRLFDGLRPKNRQTRQKNLKLLVYKNLRHIVPLDPVTGWKSETQSFDGFDFCPKPVQCFRRTERLGRM